MSDLPLYLAIGLPTLTVLPALALNLVRIRKEVRSIREDMRTQFASVRDDIRELRGDMKLLTGKVYELINQHE